MSAQYLGVDLNGFHQEPGAAAIREHIALMDLIVRPAIVGQLHRGHTYRVRFGSQLKYPVIEEILEEIVL